MVSGGLAWDVKGQLGMTSAADTTFTLFSKICLLVRLIMAIRKRVLETAHLGSICSGRSGVETQPGKTVSGDGSVALVSLNPDEAVAVLEGRFSRRRTPGEGVKDDA